MISNVDYGRKNGFTIVELLVVIVIIGILAAITTVAYSGIRERAIAVSMQSDLSNATKQIKLFYAENGIYPVSVSIDCGISPTNATNVCIGSSANGSYTTIPYSRPTQDQYVLTIVNGSRIYHSTENSTVIAGSYTTPSLAVTDPANWISVGSQVWARYNANVGTRIAGVVAQTNNGGSNIIEKYCPFDLESNCTTLGGLYLWNEAMAYSSTEGSQGICPTGSHIPSDTEIKTLELQLGMSPGSAAGQVDATGLRGTDQGTKLRTSGVSGLNLPYAGYRTSTGGAFAALTHSYLWTSSGSGINAWVRFIDDNPTVYRGLDDKNFGFSVRCVGN